MPATITPTPAPQRTGKPLTKPLTARRVRAARKVIAADKCPATTIRHRWLPMGGIWFKCVTCGELV